MVEDGFGNGRNVHYSATAEEGSVHLLQIIQTFKSFNSSWFNVRVIVIEKDFTELPALEQISTSFSAFLSITFHEIRSLVFPPFIHNYSKLVTLNTTYN